MKFDVKLGEDDPDDPIVWRAGKLLPDGRGRVMTLSRSARENLVKHFGEEKVAAYLAEKEVELEKWGVN